MTEPQDAMPVHIQELRARVQATREHWIHCITQKSRFGVTDENPDLLELWTQREKEASQAYAAVEAELEEATLDFEVSRVPHGKKQAVRDLLTERNEALSAAKNEGSELINAQQLRVGDAMRSLGRMDPAKAEDMVDGKRQHLPISEEEERELTALRSLTIERRELFLRLQEEYDERLRVLKSE